MNFINRLITKTPSIQILLESNVNKFQTIKDEKGNNIDLPIYNDWDPIKGKVIVNLNRIKTFEHQGIKIELFGIIESINKKKTVSKFLSLCKDLESATELENEITQYDFEFLNVEKPYDSFRGFLNIVKYILKATLMTSFKNIEYDQEIIVHKQYFNYLGDNELVNPPIQMEIGIEEWIHVSFHVFKSRFFLKDVIEGEVSFKLVSVKFSSMELQIIRRETLGTGQNQIAESDIVGKFEIMDGSPFRNEIIPIRLFLSAYKLTPTYINVNNKFSVQYYLNLVLVDSEERRYYKQHEIILLRPN